MAIIDPTPPLRDPVLIAAFAGWNDAADAATSLVEHLETTWGATQVAVLDPEDYYDFQVNRPTVAPSADGLRTLEWPATQLSYARRPDDGRDVLLLRGIEPSMRWRSFCTEIVGWARRLGVTRAMTLGAMLADTPHTRPVPVRSVTSDPAVAARLGLDVSTYVGPTGIVSVLLDFFVEAGIEALSVWAAVPHYVAQAPCPKATLAMLREVEDFAGVPLPAGDLPEDARAWQHGVEQLAAEDPEVADYVRRLEQQQDTADLPEASGEAIAREFERYLRRRDG